MNFIIETEQEVDGRWIAEIIDLPGAMKYGPTRQNAIAQAQAFALRVMADRIEHVEQPASPITIGFAAA